MAQSDGPARMRASDAEREQIATILKAAVTEGRLSLEEGDERLAKAYAATYRDELGPLTTDLPGGGRDALLQTPEVLAAVHRRLRRHGTFVVVLGSALVGLWLLSGAHFFWPLIPLAFLTIGLLKHWRFSRAWQRGAAGFGPMGRGPWGHHGHGPWGRRGGSGWDGGDWRGGAPERERQWR